MPRFVILEHNHPGLHWDLLLQDGDHLRGWRLAEPPIAGRMIAAEATPDHRLLYLDYEGPVSGGRGEVRRWDAGEYTLGQAEESGLCFHLGGHRIRGQVRLEPRQGQQWRAIFAGMEASTSA
jgi:hypothetical protein